MSVHYFDKYSSEGFWFRERQTDQRFCLSGKGERQGCLANFSGSIAIAVYHLTWHGESAGFRNLREKVRTIDQDVRVAPRPPYEKTLSLDGATVSDIQAFGYDPREGGKDEDAVRPWCLLRQELYFGQLNAPFLIVHWKHTLDAISLLDFIPGEGTQLISG